MKVKSITSFGESVVFQMENGETYSMAEIEKHIAEMRKPKPLLADAQVGDIVRLRNGEYKQVDDTCRQPHDIGVRVGEIWYNWDGTACVNAKNPDLDIISTEPLAEDGTAEWAWQMNKLLGKKVMHAHSNRITEGNITDTNKDMFLAITFDTGWQLYSPQPQVKVGDWVLCEAHDGKTFQARVTHDGLKNNGFAVAYNTIDDVTTRMSNSPEKLHKTVTSIVNQDFSVDGERFKVLRILKPSEVKVSLTLSGTVDMSGSDKCLALRYGKGDVEYNLIDFASLTPADAEMVRELTGGGK